MTRTMLANATLFDGERHHGDRRFAIGVDGSRIAFVREGPQCEEPGYRSIDLAGKLVLPGFIDAHTHATGASLDVATLDAQPPSYLTSHAARFLGRMVQQGFTTIRDAGGGDVGLVRAIEEGLVDGPRYRVAGKGLSQTGGHGDLRGQRESEPCACAFSGVFSRVVDGPEQVRVAVRDQFRMGAHQVKIFVSGGVLSPTDPIWMLQFNDAEVSVAVEEAARWRSYIMAHAHTKEAILRCARLGVRSIEHATLLDREAADVVAEHGTFIVPTIGVIDAMLRHAQSLPAGALAKLEPVVDAAYRAIGHAEAAGCSIGFGSDLLGSLQGGEAGEFAARAALGSTLQVLRSATSVNARLMGLQDTVGHIKAGHEADLVVADARVMNDLALLSKDDTVELVLIAGKPRRDIRHVFCIGLSAGTRPHAI